MERIKAKWLTVALCCGALLYLAKPAIAGAPTFKDLLAEEDYALVSQMVEWDKRAFALPEDLELDGPLREAAATLLQAHVARVRELIPAWIAQERAQAGVPDLRGRALSQPIYHRMINEMAIWSVESAGPAHDEAWLNAALAPRACSVIPQSRFAQRMALIQAAPPSSRQALLAGERQLMSRWGTKREALPPRPSTADLDAVDQAIIRVRAGLQVSAEPMTPFLAVQIFYRLRKPGQSDRWEQCAKSQWWLASQLASGKADRTLALAVYRYTTMLDVREFVPDSAMKPPASLSAGGNGPYPPTAAYFNVEGTTTVQAETDDHGKLLKAQVVSRKITVSGVRENRPVAFESLLDAATLDVAAKRHYPDGKATSDRFDIAWHLE